MPGTDPLRWPAIAACALLSAPAQAQGVFDMGVLTNTLSQDHVARTEAARARQAPPQRRAEARSTAPQARTAARTKANCAKVRQWTAEGRKAAQLPRILGMCEQLGY